MIIPIPHGVTEKLHYKIIKLHEHITKLSMPSINDDTIKIFLRTLNNIRSKVKTHFKKQCASKESIPKVPIKYVDKEVLESRQNHNEYSNGKPLKPSKQKPILKNSNKKPQIKINESFIKNDKNNDNFNKEEYQKVKIDEEKKDTDLKIDRSEKFKDWTIKIEDIHKNRDKLLEEIKIQINNVSKKEENENNKLEICISNENIKGAMIKEGNNEKYGQIHRININKIMDGDYDEDQYSEEEDEDEEEDEIPQKKRIKILPMQIKGRE